MIDKFDAVLLPGGGISKDGILVDSAKKRVNKAAELYKQGATKHIIFCGEYPYKADELPIITEAQAYTNYCKALGVPNKAIFLEEKSRESLGNILFAKINILMPQNWHNIAVIPTINQSDARIKYLLNKILGPNYTWAILRVVKNTSQNNIARENKSLQYTKEINDKFADGDHQAIYKGLMKTHPAYGGTKWTIEELKKELSEESFG